MELKAHFSNIHKVIINHLESAQSEIVVAIAWFTDRDLFEVLYKKARSKLEISIILIGDEINQGPSGLNFQRLQNIGGRVIFMPAGSRSEPTMHHKFCVIDRSTVITGSYNWSNKARSNDENITVVTDSTEFAQKYLDTFNRIIARKDQCVPNNADNDTTRRRLEMIRNLVLLGEQVDVPAHVNKLRHVAKALQLDRIIAAFDNGQFRVALEHIDAYLHKATSLVVAGDVDIAILRLQLATLELRVESLSSEKADFERRLIIFNRCQDRILGNLIQRILKARAEHAQRLARNQRVGKNREEAEAVVRDAQETYRRYSDQHEELQHAEPLLKLNDEDERELKALYRKACSLCHPDKFPEERKETAHHAFVELQMAYKFNNVEKLREVHQALVAGSWTKTRSTTLGEVDALKAAIAELEYALTKVIFELKTLNDSDGVKLMDSAGTSEEDWERYFERQRKALEVELDRSLAALAAEQVEE